MIALSFSMPVGFGWMLVIGGLVIAGIGLIWVTCLCQRSGRPCTIRNAKNTT
jgi:hypothetical protein